MTTDRPIVCGVAPTGSPAAVAYAADRARRDGCRLHLVGVVTLPVVDRWTFRGAANPGLAPALSALEAATRDALAQDPGLLVTHEVVQQATVAAGLSVAGRQARLIVIEQTHRGTVDRLVNGSTANGLAYATRVAILSVPRGWVPAEPGPAQVTVAVQDQEEAGHLLTDAVVAAVEVGAELVVLHAVSPLHGAEAEHNGRRCDWTTQARQDLAGPVDRATRARPDLSVRIDVVVEQAAYALVAASTHSDLLVIGRHHHSSPWGSHLGPVVRRVVLDACCPVLLPARSEPVVSSAEITEMTGITGITDVDESGTAGHPNRGDVVLAVGDEPMTAAIAFAVDEARRRGTGLHLVRVVQLRLTDGASDEEEWWDSRDRGRALVAAAAGTAHGQGGGSVLVTTHVAEHGGIVDRLVEQGARGSVLVLQRRNLTGARRLLAQSITNGVVSRCSVPVIAVPTGWDGPGAARCRVVVAVDDPATAAPILAFALTEAARRDATVVVVHALERVVGPTAVVLDENIQRERAEHCLDLLRSEVDGLSATGPHPAVEYVVRAASPAELLLATSTAADVLVVGRHHRRPLGSHLGPTAGALLRSARCPVIVGPTAPPGG